ncbi:hypothetical protein TNCV_1644631 [Trichonephila clavipes]|nr:hypothetical protein TNCV_1644631 [Trichonephila clavipes]
MQQPPHRKTPDIAECAEEKTDVTFRANWEASFATLKIHAPQARLSDLSPIENVWSMVMERLTRHRTAVTTVDELWPRAETAWSSVPVHAIQYLFDSMPWCISPVITARGGCSEY